MFHGSINNSFYLPRSGLDGQNEMIRYPGAALSFIPVNKAKVSFVRSAGPEQSVPVRRVESPTANRELTSSCAAAQAADRWATPTSCDGASHNRKEVTPV